MLSISLYGGSTFGYHCPMKQLFCFLLLLFCVRAVQAQEPDRPAEMHSPEALKTDLLLLREQLEAIHTGLYAYTDKAAMDRSFDSLYASIEEPMSSITFYRMLSVLHAKIKNGHTALLPAASYDAALQKALPRLPLSVYWHEGKLYVTEDNATEQTITEGSQILQINGEDAGQVMDLLVSRWTRDGNNRSKPERDVCDNFAFFYAYFIGIPAVYEVEVLSPAGTKSTQRIAALPKPDILQNQQVRYGSDSTKTAEKALSFAIKGDTALMTIRDFSTAYYKQTGQDYEAFFADAFTRLASKNTRHLILDLRDNTGGNAAPVATLLSYLVKESFTCYKAILSKSKTVPKPRHYQNKIAFWNLSSWTWMRKTADGYRYTRGEYGLKPTQPSAPTYGGKVYVLINANSFSATGELASLLQDKGIGTFIGEEAGGNASQNTSGYTPVLVLPNTRLRMLIPTQRFILDVHRPNEGHGVRPDHEVKPEIEDLLQGRDVVMDFTLDLISRSED